MMKNVALIAVLTALTAACGSDDSPGKGSQGGSTAGGSGGSKPGTSAGTSSGAQANSGGSSGGSSASAGKDGQGDAGAPSIGGPEDWVPQAMPLISRDVPVFVSGTAQGGNPKSSNDADPGSAWRPDKMPCWIAYDLSGVAEEQRHQILVVWYAIHAGGYIFDQIYPDAASPIDYAIEINDAAGGGSPPADGWKAVANVTENMRSTLQHLVDLDGGNWVRMTVTKSSDPNGTLFDLDVHSAPHGASDSWLFMGDSITHLATGTHPYMDIPAQVRAKDPERWPVIIPAAIGGTNTGSAKLSIDETLKYYPGRFVVLGYGTNDHKPSIGMNGEHLGFDMEPLVEKVLAAGKIPAIPHMPWADVDGIQAEGPLNNAEIDRLYEKYPQIYHGPDLWAGFLDRTDLIPTGDVHPNEEGLKHWRKLWADAMVPE